MGKLSIIETPLEGLYVVDANPFLDSRGEWCRVFCQNELNKIIGDRHILNMNFSKTLKKGSIRGMHYQLPPMAEMKLIRCLNGKIFDVAVDLRKNSKTYLQWYGLELSEDNRKMFVIPEGFAHGFQALSDNVEMIYLHTQYYSPELERGVRYNDPALDIKWQLPPMEISERDKNHPLIDTTFEGIVD